MRFLRSSPCFFLVNLCGHTDVARRYCTVLTDLVINFSQEPELLLLFLLQVSRDEGNRKNVKHHSLGFVKTKSLYSNYADEQSRAFNLFMDLFCTSWLEQDIKYCKIKEASSVNKTNRFAERKRERETWRERGSVTVRAADRCRGWRAVWHWELIKKYKHIPVSLVREHCIFINICVCLCRFLSAQSVFVS